MKLPRIIILLSFFIFIAAAGVLSAEPDTSSGGMSATLDTKMGDYYGILLDTPSFLGELQAGGLYQSLIGAATVNQFTDKWNDYYGYSLDEGQFVITAKSFLGYKIDDFYFGAGLGFWYANIAAIPATYRMLFYDLGGGYLFDYRSMEFDIRAGYRFFSDITMTFPFGSATADPFTDNSLYASISVIIPIFGNKKAADGKYNDPRPDSRVPDDQNPFESTQNSGSARPDGDNTGDAEKNDNSAAIEEEANTSFLSFDIVPSGSEIYIDGTFLGLSPIYNFKTAEGVHKIRIISEGYNTLELQVEVSEGRSLLISESLNVTAEMVTAGTELSPEKEGTAYTLNTGLNMIPVQGGNFEMGSNDGDFDERPVTKKYISPYYISSTEVTQSVYSKIMGKNPSYFDDDKNKPVDSVSWYDAILFCNRFSEAEGLRPAYFEDKDFKTVYEKGTEVFWDKKSEGYRLPTEAEWELAAAGGTSPGPVTVYSGSDDYEEVAWRRSLKSMFKRRSTKTVSEYKPNFLGLYDMSGNVAEWCWDWYGSYNLSVTMPNNPEGPSEGSGKVIRGGSFESEPRDFRVKNRNYLDPVYRSYEVGIRLVRSVF